MRGPLNLDRSLHNFGAATTTVLQILNDWEAIDWFEPTAQPPKIGQKHFVHHQRLCVQYAPKHFAQPLQIQHRLGGWPEFVACCQAVRTEGASNWKHGQLKRMAHDHSQRYGFSRKQIAVKLVEPEEVCNNRLLYWSYGDLFFIGNLGPILDFRSLGSGSDDSASFYLSYAHGDALDAIEWQLAEPNCPLANNPYVALLRCYSTGYYPFVHQDGRVVLFRFV